jgi:hypothetical protein
MTDLPVVPTPRCMNLHSKAMMVHGEGFADDPEALANMWCVLTGRGLGPDGGEVALDCCNDRARGCYQEY